MRSLSEADVGEGRHTGTKSCNVYQPCSSTSLLSVYNESSLTKLSLSVKTTCLFEISVIQGHSTRVQLVISALSCSLVDNASTHQLVNNVILEGSGSEAVHSSVPAQRFHRKSIGGRSSTERRCYWFGNVL